MNEQRFFDLAMKAISRQSTEAERAEFNSLLAAKPELKTEFERMQADSQLAKEVLPLVAAVDAVEGEFPTYARERLQTKVRQTLGQRQPATARVRWNWRWVISLAAAAAAIVTLTVIQMRKPIEPAIEVALLDTAGPVRGSEPEEIATLKRQWNDSSVASFNKAEDLKAWETNWPAARKTAAKVIYDRNAAEVRVLFDPKTAAKPKVFPVQTDLKSTLDQANSYIRQEMRR